jgi:hypothetical protein
MAGGADRRAPPTENFQLSDSVALTASDQDVAISGAMLSRSLFRCGVERGRDQHPDPQGLGS